MLLQLRSEDSSESMILQTSTEIEPFVFPLKYGMQNALDYSASNSQPTIGDLSQKGIGRRDGERGRWRWSEGNGEDCFEQNQQVLLPWMLLFSLLLLLLLKFNDFGIRKGF